MKQFWVFIIYNKSRRLYTGMTSDLAARVIATGLIFRCPDYQISRSFLTVIPLFTLWLFA